MHSTLFVCTYLMQYYPEVVALLSRQEQNLRILFVCLYVWVCVWVYYLLLTGCRALFTFNQYFVTFGSGHLRKKRGNDNRQQTVSNSLFCVYVYAKYNQTTDRARGTVLPPFPLLTILPTVLANERETKRGRERERAGEGGTATLQRLRQQKQIKWKLFAVNMHTHTHTHTTHIQRVYACVCVCKQLKAASQLTLEKGEGGQTIGRANMIEWLKLELCKHTNIQPHTHTHTYIK